MECNMGSTEVITGTTAALLTVLLIIAVSLRRFWWPSVRHHFERHTDYIDSLPASRLPLWIALAAGLGLFAELMMIRIHSSYFQLFAYFKNVSLLSCFLGLGVGYIRGSRRPLLTPLVMPVFVLQVLILYLLRFTETAAWLHSPVTETIAFGFGSASKFWQFVTVYLFLIVVFIANAACFIPIGHLTSRLMMRMDKLPSYSWNLIGSLIGIAVFSGISYAWAPPSVWLALFAVGTCLILYRQPKSLAVAIVATIVLVVLLRIPLREQTEDIYSPYQILTVEFNDDSPPAIEACNTFHQNIYDLRPSSIGDSRNLQHWSIYYGLPYSFKPQPEDVLILGSGAGNDVAAGLRHRAGYIDAVEIDPVIMDCGVKWHPEEPYQAERVNAIVDDARGHLRRTDKKYDLIVYGLLDSHSLLSSASGGVRLDSYVYTVEGFSEARERLKPDGLITLSFCVINLELGKKLYRMLEMAFDGESPRVFSVYSDASMCFVIGEDMTGRQFQLPLGVREMTPLITRPSEIETDVSTDNWPFFYMLKQQFPLSYILVIIALIGASIVLTVRLAPGAGSGFSTPCFFLGAGFMLIETKSITELALVFGSTWIVISVVIAAILILAFFANLLVIRIGTPRREITYALLGIALLIGLGQTFINAGFLSLTMQQLLMTLLLTLPLFFSGFAFSTELKKSASVAIALSSNLLGAMLGGFLEYNAMYFGYRSLYIIAIIMYGLAYLGSVRQRGTMPSPT